MRKLLRRLVFGDDDIKEFSTITVAGEAQEKVYLEIGGQIIEVSEKQFLLCLEPVFYGVWLDNDVSLSMDTAKSSFTLLFMNVGSNKPIARVNLILFDQITESNGCLYILKQIESSINHIPAFAARLIFSRHYKKPGFSFAQLKAFAAAYSYPRRVRIVSFREKEYYNIFPMDLLGDLDSQYVFGLRNTNKTLPLILKTKKLVVAEVPSTYKKIMYDLGAQHRSAPLLKELLPFNLISSHNFNCYLPDWTNSYKEVVITKSINLGSHTLLWAKVENRFDLTSSTGHLSHIHYLLYLFHKRKKRMYPQI